MPIVWQDIDVEQYIPWINNLGAEIAWLNNNGEVIPWRAVTAWTTINTNSFVPSGPV
jgi:hypothetical protein